MLPSGLQDQVADEEKLARFVFSSSDIRKEGKSNIAKPSAFYPFIRDRETSVFRLEGELIYENWQMGLEAAGGRTLKGVAIITAEDVRTAHLKVTKPVTRPLEVLASEPPDRHAVIKGWFWDPEDDPRKSKDLQLDYVVQLASCAKLLIYEQSS